MYLDEKQCFVEDKMKAFPEQSLKNYVFSKLCVSR